MKQICDIAVIGRDLASLVAALIASRWGRKTILIAEQGFPGGYEFSGYRFPVDPTPMSGFGPSQTFLKLFAELDLPLPERSRLERLDPAMQVLLPSCRLDLSSDRDALCFELTREFPSLKNELLTFFTCMQKTVELFDQWMKFNPLVRPSSLKEALKLLKLTPKLIRARMALRNLARLERSEPAIKRIFEAQKAVLSHWHLDGLQSLSSAYTFSLPWRGIYYPAGDPGSLVESMKKSFEDMGGTIITDCSVVRLRAHEGIEADMKVGDDTVKVLADRLIVSTKWENLPMILLGERKFQRLARRLRGVRNVRYPFTIHLGVHEVGLPEKLAPFAAVVSDVNRSVMEENLIFLHTSRSGDVEHAPAGRRAVAATFFLNESPLRLNNEELKIQVLAALDRLDAFLPFLRDNIEYMNIGKSTELARCHQEVINQKFQTASDPFFGLITLRNKTPAPNVFLTGGLLLAGLGYEGEIMAGVHSAYAALAKEGVDYDVDA